MDTFLYYSIPSVLRAALHNEHVDLPSLKNLANLSISRKSRLSYES
jgi:hypothetical protein